MLLFYYAACLPYCLPTMLLFYHAACLPYCLPTMLPAYHAATLPCCHKYYPYYHKTDPANCHISTTKSGHVVKPDMSILPSHRSAPTAVQCFIPTIPLLSIDGCPPPIVHTLYHTIPYYTIPYHLINIHQVISYRTAFPLFFWSRLPTNKAPLQWPNDR